ncbi:hypothetical protein BDZ89DRAFT_79421 [Hymenopellis radicata]|nr:hypothetical protein BDZ89DRAFT_79421 [Hymenopellis radicata]
MHTAMRRCHFGYREASIRQHDSFKLSGRELLSLVYTTAFLAARRHECYTRTAGCGADKQSRFWVLRCGRYSYLERICSLYLHVMYAAHAYILTCREGDY